MAKCIKCGKKGIFLKLNSNKICKDCEYQAIINSKETRIKDLEVLLLPEQRDIIKLNNKIKDLSEQRSTLCKSIKDDSTALNNLLAEIKQKKDQIIVLDDEILYQSFALYTPIYDFAKSEDYKDELDRIRDRQKEMIKNETVCSANTEWTLNGSAAQGRKMVRDGIKLMVRCFNTECENVIDRVKFNNIESMRKRITTMYDQVNKLNTAHQIAMTPQYRDLKIDELNLAHEYQLKKQQEKEELKEQRAQLREQVKLEQEIKAAREKLEKDKKHHRQAIDEVARQISACINESEKEKLLNKLSELNVEYEKFNDAEKQIDYREQNAKAGYVYIISNVGAFGEDIYKIGMTRRLEPMDRIDELGDASVPFSFDVHALIFSNNAPELESKLHKHFEMDRLNKINSRKEFYKTNICDIEKVVKELYDNTIDMVKTPPAEQYRESLLIAQNNTTIGRKIYNG